MNWFERQLERLRAFNPWIVDSVLAVLFALLGVVSVFSQDIRDDAGLIEEGFREPTPLILFTLLLTCVPVVFRRRWPLATLVVASIGVILHIGVEFPEGALPAVVLFLTFSVAAWGTMREALAGLGVVAVTIIVLRILEAPGLNTVSVFAVMAQFAGVWAVGIALRARRQTLEARVSEAEERANVESQRAARVLAEERLRIAQELHDVVAHSMSVIAVQAGVGAHVLDSSPDDARAALDAISATSRGALAEMRRLLGVLRDEEGERSHQPAPTLSDVPQLVHDVRAAGVPVTLDISGGNTAINPAVELSAYRVVQEALTNVIKHAGSPSRVGVTVDRGTDVLTVEVVDNGRGAAASVPSNGARADGSGHGLIGMRERVELWGGELAVGPVVGGGYRVRATLPYCEAE